MIWNNTLLAQSRVDKVVTMNTYTTNDATFTKKAKELSAIFQSKLILGMEHDANNTLNASRLASRFRLIDELNVSEVWVWKNGDLFSKAWVDQLRAWATPVAPRSHVALGYLAVTVSCVLFGSFSVFIKQKKVQAANMAPVVMQVYFAIAIFFSSWLTVAVHPFVFTPYGFAGGVIWSLASMLSFVAIRHAGLSVGQGVWSGASILTSFIWGVAVAHEKVHRLPVAITALAIMIAGIAGIALTPARSSVSAKDDEGALEQHLAAGGDGFARIPGDEVGAAVPAFASGSSASATSASNSSGRTRGQIAFGLAVSVAVGLVNGSIMVPFVFNKVKAIVYLVSFSFGVCAATAFALLLWVAVTKAVPDFHVRTCALPCILSGALWNVGNASSVYATAYLGQSIGFSLTQLSLLIGGMWAVFFFKEITGTKSVTQYFVSAAVLLTGAIMLGMFG